MDRYSTFWPRLCAGFLDGLVLSPISMAAPYLSQPNHGTIFLICWSIFATSAYYVYSVWMHARYGQTLGKKWLGVQVLDVAEGRIPTLWQAFLRDIGDIVPSALGLCYTIYLILTHHYSPAVLEASLFLSIVGWSNTGWFLLEIGTMLTNHKHRALHDLIARTVVVRTEHYTLEEGLGLSAQNSNPTNVA